MAFRYLSKNDETIQGIFAQMFSFLVEPCTFDPERWKHLVASAWANKISNLMQQEMEGNV